MMKNAVTYEDLKIDLPVKLYKIMDLKIEESLNNHATAYITGLLEQEEELKAIYNLTIESNIKIKATIQGEEKILFSGVPVKVDVTHQTGVYEVKIVLNSYSIYLDFKLKSRSFQNKKNTYAKMFKEIMAEYGGAVLVGQNKESVQNAPVIQYEETDWEFMKRMASHIGTKLFPEIKSDKPNLYIGINEGNTHQEENHNYTIEKNIEKYLSQKENYGGCKEEDVIVYQVESTQQYALGDQVTYKKVALRVVEKVSKLHGGLLVHTYRLQKAAGFKQNIFYNTPIKGRAIEGTVLAVEKDKLKLHLSIDASQTVDEAYWYPFDTSYTAEGQTGWYSMPQEGDSVNLYIPQMDERKAYVKRSNRTDGEDNPKVQDPAIKYYGTIDGKEMKLAPTEFSLSAKEEVVHIKMTDDSGIEVISDNDICIRTDKAFYAECETMTIESADKIILATSSASIIVDDIVHLKG